MIAYDSFLKLHQASSPLVLGNVWDVQSAQVFEAAGYTAVGTSSMAVAKAWGYDDGENIAFDHVLRLARRITGVVRIPLTVDIEGGYSRDLATITDHVQKLTDAGVAGINLEDSVNGKLLPVGEFQQLLSGLADYLSRNNLKVFVNVRTDAFLLGQPSALNETLDRIAAYENLGASGIFVPCIADAADIRAVTGATTLPINVMCVPALPDFKTLGELGVRRISMGPFLFNRVYKEMGALARAVLNSKSFSPIL
jgi:2-methylisocitrate lyase-like PEP mutase family enzyme